MVILGYMNVYHSLHHIEHKYIFTLLFLLESYSTWPFFHFLNQCRFEVVHSVVLNTF